MKEIKLSWWLFELPEKQHSLFSLSGSTFLPCLSLPSRSYHDSSISSIFLESPHQVDMKKVVKSSKHILRHFSTLETHSDLIENWGKMVELFRTGSNQIYAVKTKNVDSAISFWKGGLTVRQFHSYLG